MLILERDTLRNLESLGSGTFGRVYRYDNEIALKIYHPTVKTTFGNLRKNPQLKKLEKALRMRKIDKKLKYTDLVKDLVYIDGKYAGIVIPYYDGITLNHMMDAPLELKIDISKQLVRNCKELTSNHIYPLDFKLNNMIYVDGEVKILDLDDCYTKYMLFDSEIHKRDAICGLDETIKTYFGEYRDSGHTSTFAYYLQRERVEGKSEYREINEYLGEKEKGLDYLFIDINSDIDEIKRIKNNGKYRIILLYDSPEYNKELFEAFFKVLDKNNVFVYDLMRRCDFDLYFTNNKSNNMQFVKRR